VQFRFVFTSDNTSFGAVDGWAIDDFELYVPVDAATNTITFGNTSPLPLPGTNNVKINIQNIGLMALSNVNLTLKIDNTVVVTDPVTFAPVLAPNASINHQFSLPWTGATPGLHTVKVWSSAPNGLVDTNMPNDTTTWVISVMDTFATYPYCNNFETGNGIPPLTTMNALRFTDTKNDWQQGTPNKNIIIGAHGGTQCWMTDLNLNYLRNDSSGLFLPVFTVDTVHCYHLEFWNRYLTEVNKDGGIVEYSFDMGYTWTQLGQPFESNWYNNANATGLGTWSPNFGGTSNGWVQEQHDIRFSQAGQVIFRFRFGSDNAIESEGWAIDDVCFQQNAPCVLAVHEQTSPDGLNMVAYPNPAGTSSVLEYNLPENGKVLIALHDMLGRTIQSFEGEQPMGRNAWTVDVSNLPEGVYFYELTFGSQRIVQKLVVSH
ncbi:MAG TPA: T9SS type A sorting domain-containing protein, partial [Bacteroidia bacterium]|nr:T9SS type A sorting domain-containing protein [Bacteroidia bacterium]